VVFGELTAFGLYVLRNSAQRVPALCTWASWTVASLKIMRASLEKSVVLLIGVDKGSGQDLHCTTCFSGGCPDGVLDRWGQYLFPDG
jgi:hypothetical protein